MQPLSTRCAEVAKVACSQLKVFSFLQPLQRGDLSVFIWDHAGPVEPERITYSLFFCRPDGSSKRVGPEGRIPVTDVQGEYHAVGCAGELDQAGCWAIRWDFQRTSQSSIQTVSQCFRVLDAVLAADPRDTTVRVLKRGWS